MTKLESLTTGVIAKGIIGDEPITVVASQWYGSAVLEITYKDTNGNVGNILLYRSDENNIELIKSSLPWSFDADADMFKLVSEAYRINMAYLFDPYLAVHTSSVEPLPHQISAVYQDMLPRLPLRYVLADDPGAGKTIMTGLLIKELIARGDLKRCLIVSPGSLVEQWQDELFSKFHIHFTIITNDLIESAATGNVFNETDLAICRLDKLSRNDDVQNKLRATEWDLIVCDEAHKMSASVWGGEVKYTKRFQLGKMLSTITRNFLLLTATPHNGKEEDFHLFLSLVDPDRFEGAHRLKTKKSVDVSDVMRRLVKEELLKFDGRPLFPERIAYTVNYDLSPQESQLYKEVTEYVQNEFNRADNLNKERKSTVGFALTILQRRLASSPEAIYQSLYRRRQKLEYRLSEERLGKHSEEYYIDTDDYDEDDITPEDLEDERNKIIDHATAAATIEELEAEIKTLKELEKLANNVRSSGIDRKWDELSKLLQDNEAMFSNGEREKLIVFTEHKDTLNYLVDKISSLLGTSDAVVTIHGGMHRDDRKKAEELFKQDAEVRILVATDAAGEGINLQRAHLMINYDIPWNPNRLEQRFGRIHRIGQTEVCHLWNLVANETREGMVFQRLFQKLDEERNALGGKVFDILGKATFDNRTLKDLLIEAIRYGNDPEVRARLNRIVDNSINTDAFMKLIQDNALTDDFMDGHVVNTIREKMERIEAHKLQPHFIGAFFIEAFTRLGGKIKPKETGRYEITSVPSLIRSRENRLGMGQYILKSYERVCFEKDYCNIPGKPLAELLCPGHPLLQVTIDLIRERNADILKRGAILINDNDYGEEAKLLFYIEDTIQDGVTLPNGNRRVVSKNIHFVEMDKDGNALNAGFAPYLDFRPAKAEESDIVKKWMNGQNWLDDNVEDFAKGYAIESLIPKHSEEFKERTLARISKTEKAVKDRLTAEIQYWDYKAADLREKENSGKYNHKLNSENCAKRADDLQNRLNKRLSELELEKKISLLPPVITGGALIIPKGLISKLQGQANPDMFAHGDRQAVEFAGMKAVMDIEEELGFKPRDVSAEKVGYDIESLIPENMRDEANNALRLIEVKGRVKGATTVTVSKNEILTALNKPESFILAVVEVDGDKTHTIYLKHPFENRVDWTATSVNYDLQDLISASELILEK